ncbi:hypothetical protein JTY60_02510 [symbiont of Argiope bruennichi]|uniref:hypothetical protein n=1 Tax=symbiont of Argiope bruennichi TaxID=2810479 RepID=UPI003DA68FDE
MNKIVLDCLGFDNSESEAYAAAFSFCHEFPDAFIEVIGTKKEWMNFSKKYIIPSNLFFIECNEKIEQKDLGFSIKDKQGCSMALAISKLQEDDYCGMVTAGNSAAFVLECYSKLKIDEQSTPVLCGMLPNIKKKEASFFLDIGANIDIQPEKLLLCLPFLVKYYKNNGNNNISIKILSNGEEVSKGNAFTHKTTELLQKNSEYSKYFDGYVEPTNLLKTNADIILSDGWSGNLALKGLEGGILSFIEDVKNNINKRFLFKIFSPLVKMILKKTIKKLDYNYVGGAILLNVKKVCIKAHGASNKISFYHALKKCYDFANIKQLN